MMIARLGWILVLAVACSVVETGEANAQCGIGGGCYGQGLGFGYDTGRLYRVLSQNVPYYAAFPPVYYSAPVPRTYGYSPFAYPPGTATPDLPAPTVAAQEIINPHAPATAAPSEAKAYRVTQNASSTGPLAIVNPYYQADELSPQLRAVALND